jgi:hypothetical protein
MAKGMDAMQKWANENPKKAALVNTAAGIGGAITGAMATNMFSGNTQADNQNTLNNNAMTGISGNNPLANAEKMTPGEFTSWNDNVGYFNAYKNPEGEIIYQSKDGSLYKKIDTIGNIDRWSKWAGSNWSKPSFMTK